MTFPETPKRSGIPAHNLPRSTPAASASLDVAGFSLAEKQRKEFLALIWLDEETGHLFCRKTGKRRGGKHDSLRYRCITLLGKTYREHRVIWLLKTGRWPAQFIDHINGDPADNRPCNLREATASQNMKNRKPAKNGKSPFLGVYYEKGAKKGRNGKPGMGGFRACIRSGDLSKKSKHFHCHAAAAKLYDKWAHELHGEFANLNFPALVIGTAPEKGNP